MDPMRRESVKPRNGFSFPGDDESCGGVASDVLLGLDSSVAVERVNSARKAFPVVGSCEGFDAKLSGSAIFSTQDTPNRFL
jgi:hypothetical protein